MNNWKRPPAPNIVLSVFMTVIAVVIVLGIVLLLTEPTIKYGP